MDETGLRVEMTALPSCTLAILLTLARENHRGIRAFSGLGGRGRTSWHTGCNFPWHEEFGGLQGEVGT